MLGACTRHADIRDEPDGAIFVPPPKLDGGGLTELDAGLESDAFAPCAERPIDDECVGTNDFPCGFDLWLPIVAEDCQTKTGCKTNGWIELKLGGDGCAKSIAMDQPNDEIVACLVERLGGGRCPCPQVEGKYFFGEGNSGECKP